MKRENLKRFLINTIINGSRNDLSEALSNEKLKQLYQRQPLRYLLIAASQNRQNIDILFDCFPLKKSCLSVLNPILDEDNLDINLLKLFAQKINHKDLKIVLEGCARGGEQAAFDLFFNNSPLNIKCTEHDFHRMLNLSVGNRHLQMSKNIKQKMQTPLPHQTMKVAIEHGDANMVNWIVGFMDKNDIMEVFKTVTKKIKKDLIHDPSGFYCFEKIITQMLQREKERRILHQATSSGGVRRSPKKKI